MEKLVKQIIEIYAKIRFRAWPQNLFLKLLSLFFAIFLWYFVVGEDKVDTTVYIPLEIVNLPRDLVVANQYKKQLEVAVTGPRGLIRGLSRQHTTRSVDLSKATPGTVVVRNTPDSIPFPRGIDTLQVQPSHVTLIIDKLISKELAVKPVIQGKPAKGYEVDTVVLEPATIILNGPQGVLGDKIFLSTNVINVADLKETVQTQVTLDLTPEVTALIGETILTAKIVIKEHKQNKVLSKVPLEIEHTADRTTYKIKPPTVKITAEIPYSMAKETEDFTSLVKASVNAASLPPGRHELKVDISYSPELNILQVTPDVVTVLIGRPKPLKKRKPEN